MSESELYKYQHKIFILLKNYKLLWEKHIAEPEVAELQEGLMEIQRRLVRVDAQQKHIVKQMRLKRRYEQQQKRLQQCPLLSSLPSPLHSSLPSSPRSSLDSDSSTTRSSMESTSPRRTAAPITPCSTVHPSTVQNCHQENHLINSTVQRLAFNVNNTQQCSLLLADDKVNTRNGGRPFSSSISDVVCSASQFLDEDNWYLLEEDGSRVKENGLVDHTSAFHTSSDKDSSRLCSNDPQDIVTHVEFMQTFGMLPSSQLTEVLLKRSLRQRANRSKLFFQPSAAERRDAKRKKKYLQGGGGPSSQPPSRGSSPPATEPTPQPLPTELPACVVCSLSGLEGATVSECGGCGCWCHPLCGPTVSPSLWCVGDPWLCRTCQARGIRAPLQHDPLLIRHLKLTANNGSRCRDASRSASGVRKGDSSKSRKTASDRKTGDRKVSKPARAATPTIVPRTASPLKIKTRGRAQRRPPAKLTSPLAASRQCSVNQLNLATRPVKIAHHSNTILGSSPGTPAASVTINSVTDGSSNNTVSPNNITICGIKSSASSNDIIRINKSARINLTKITTRKINDVVPSNNKILSNCKTARSKITLLDPNLNFAHSIQNNSSNIASDASSVRCSVASKSNNTVANSRITVQAATKQTSSDSVIRTRNITGKLQRKTSVCKDASLVNVFRRLLTENT